MKITKASWGKVIFPAIFVMAVTVLLLLPFWHSTAANPTINNGNFETGPFVTQNVITGWTVFGNAANLQSGATSGTHGAGLSAGSDSQGDAIQQVITTVNGQKYNLDFDAGIFGRRSGAPLQVRVEVVSNGTVVNSVISPPDAGTFTASQVQFNHYQFPFTAGSTSTTLRFTSVGTGNGAADQIIDTVTVSEVASNGTTTVCDARGAVADSCFTLLPPPCGSGQAFYFPNADCTIPARTDCVPSDLSSASDGFRYIFTVGPGNLTPKDAVFTEDPVAGTATLVGHLESQLRPGYGFDVNMTWSGRTNDSSGGMGPLLELDPGCYRTAQNPGAPVNVATWHFYANGFGTLTGTGNYNGAIVNLIPVMHYFQVGAGASGKNVAPGMSGWFTWVVQRQPFNPQFCLRNGTPNGPSADFNLNCDNERGDCSGQIGDFVWQDNNSNGCQDPGEPGIPGVTVELFTGCGANKTLIDSTTTDNNGKYLFTDLCAGDYTVRFHTPAGFTHTVANANCNVGGQPSDSTDSDCVCTGTSTPCDVCVNLPTDNSTNLTIDCGYIPPCVGQIGDFVWNDLNGNGCQDPNEPGISNVKVDLYTGCGVNKVFKQTANTDSNGKYLFTGLCAGDYTVSFTTPNGFTHTVANAACNVGGQPPDSTDSDCACTGTASPCDVCVTLPMNGTNLTIDCGYISACDLAVTKSCVVPTPAPTATAFDCSKLKPINELKMIWNGSQTICIKAYKGGTTTQLISTQCNITPGTLVTVTGMAGAPNDVIWEIFTNNGGTPGTLIGQSTFHISCSDVDMNGPEDCGKAAGDGKGKTGFINTWIFAGMSGNGFSIDCGSSNGGGNGNTNCTLTPGTGPGCNPETGLGKPTSLTFQYTGGACGGNNPQSGKFICSGTINGALPITVSNQDSYTQSTTTVQPGGTITFTKGGSTLSAQSDFTLSNSGGTMTLSIHTSCSQPLHVGDVFGPWTLVGFNGATGGNAIVYHYEVKNNGATTLNNVFLNDDKLGQIAGPFSLTPGQTKTFDVQTSLTQTTTNTATASVQGQNCSAQSNPVTVTLASPTPTPIPSAPCSELKPINELRMQWNGAQTICIKAYKGGTSTQLLSTQCNITPGTLVTVTGMAGAPNDVIWEIFTNNGGTPGTLIGQSTFHISCSDADMNGPEDCGKAEGDGKGKVGFINTWIFKGMAGNGKQIACP